MQRIANSWAKAYESFRAEEIATATGRTTNELQAEQDRLIARIESARADLAEFAERNDIVSLERDENRALAALTGLHNSLAKARERVVDAQANLEAVDAAIALGANVVPD
ncbi:hypothetical protein [Thiorhodovibrio winogradskyi]|uniref:hypothetical protein n=1 Tax=Thiorhodovibrio winogradskyi TaxID=77007 RepID=UPI002E2A3416|nr:hypothetical protein [Thiorhodovibrio winogradskyi]